MGRSVSGGPGIGPREWSAALPTGRAVVWKQRRPVACTECPEARRRQDFSTRASMLSIQWTMDSDVITEQMHQIPWMLTRFVEQLTGSTAVVCSDEEGTLTAMSENVSRGRAEDLVALGAGLASLSSGAARRLDVGPVGQVGVEMADGYLFVRMMRSGSFLCVLTGKDVDLAALDYEMVVLADRFDGLLTPQAHDRLRALLPVD